MGHTALRQRGFLPVPPGLSLVGLGKAPLLTTLPSLATTSSALPFRHVTCPLPQPPHVSHFYFCAYIFGAGGTDEAGQELFGSFCPTESRTHPANCAGLLWPCTTTVLWEMFSGKTSRGTGDLRESLVFQPLPGSCLFCPEAPAATATTTA